MRLAWAIVAGLAVGAAIGGWSMWRDRAAGPPGATGTRTPPAAADPAAPAPTLYRWRDDAGTLHITDRPPAGRPYEVVTLRDDQNVVSMSGPAPEPEPEAAPAD
ncbi:DUF4124 domain-containing protein [Arenimonas terrae]|jgi:hypothetical protein|uniref:DUF4124 domain-containing protein n=1 Tax=Arenimonas terrae TaxID=2546226 RepID=A0A5C4RRK6_9GAMM|nr:DUF4124 domain-containing protein [Arenimonas terrae]TNJ33810.1 DUF4124 domain-containing protein [Arenimonas terrae]